MIRVVHVVHSLSMGGLEKGIATVITNASGDFRHEVVCLTTSGEAARLMPESTPIHEMGMRPGNSLRFVLRLARKLRELAPDVVHSRNWAGMDAIAASRWARLRVVHGEHGWDVGDPDGRSRKRRAVRRFLQRWVKEFTCVSRHMESWLRDDVGIRRRITQIYNGVDTERFRPRENSAVRAELGISPRTFVVGIVARLDPIKDHEALLEAFEAVRVTHPDSALIIAGSGPREQAIRARTGPGVHLLGHRRDVPEILAALDVFVLPSRNEGISNTILEAMATGVPVVASRVGGSPELLDEGVEGAIFAPGDVSALAERLRNYASDPECRDREGAAARRRALARYSIRSMVDAYEATWRRVGN